MKTRKRWWLAGALALVSACVVPAYSVQSSGRWGYGGSGVNLAAASDACRRQAYAEGWRFVREDQVRVTGPYTARIRFEVAGAPFRDHVTCFYDARSNLADVR